ncbi:MAG: hypothetical protein GQE15_18645 [Archangiaceae bacterium]|nr:hypothetical protein [Archangiaceae bacterium]
MNLRRNVVVALGGAVLLVGGAAFAIEAPDDDATVTKPAPEPEPEATFAYELTMGFAGSVLDPSAMPLVFQSGEAVNVPGATGLTAPFGGASLRQLITAGPSWETRAIQSHVRFTLGLQKPYAAFRQGSIDADVDATGSPLTGTPVHVSPRSLSLWVIRFGLGGEYTFGRVTPFADVLGDVQLATAEITVGGQPGTYKSSGFGFSVRAGARVRVDKYLSVGLAGEYGLVGTPRYGASLMVGWVFPID